MWLIKKKEKAFSQEPKRSKRDKKAQVFALKLCFCDTDTLIIVLISIAYNYYLLVKVIGSSRWWKLGNFRFFY